MNLQTFSDSRGDLTVIERVLPFEIRRVFYVLKGRGVRAGHRHLRNHLALISVQGSVKVICDDGNGPREFLLNNARQCLLIPPGTWHSLKNFSDDSIVLFLASHEYDPKDHSPN